MVSRIILGIDPGLQVTGFAILKKEQQRAFLLDYGCLQFSSTLSITERIGRFNLFFQDKITHFQITHIALETPFLGKNAQSFLKLGYLRGILHCLAYTHKLSLTEYTPTQVKLSVTGYGAAKKDQVARVVVQLFPALKMPEKLDITDALAVTLCCFFQQRSLMPY